MSEQVETAFQCANCGAEGSGAFCCNCGQRHLSKRLNVPEVASELLDSIVRLDSRLWRTFIGLTRNPGKLASDYVAGKRASYVNPVRYCLAGIALSAAATITTGEFEQISTSFLPDGVTSADASVRELTNMFAKYLNLLAVLSVPIYTVFLRLFFLKAGRNMAEIFSFSCYMVGHVSLLGVFATLINSYIYFMGLWPSVAINTYVTVYGGYAFFRRGFTYSLFAINMSYMAYLTVLGAMFWLVFTLQATN